MARRSTAGAVGLPDGPKGRWLVGTLYDYERDPLGFLRGCAQRYGDVFSMGARSLVVNDPDLVREVLSRTNRDFSADLPRLSSRRNRDLVNGMPGIDAWMRARRRGWHGMTTDLTRAHGRRILDLVDEMLRAADGREIAVTDVLRSHGGRMAVDFCLGADSGAVAEAVATRARIADRLASSSLTLPTWLPLPRVRAMVRAGARLDETMAAHVRHRRAHPSGTCADLLDLLLAEDGDPLDDAQVVGVVKANLLASYSTPGVALAWIVHLLTRHPAQLAVLRAEAAALASDTGSVLDETRLPRAEAFVRETLRLYPPIWLIPRRTLRTCRLGQWTLQPGQMVLFSPYLLQRDPRRWPDAAEFRPQRWLGNDPLPHRYAFLPFSGGPRICLGIQLAMYQLVVTTAWLAYGYDIHPTDTPVRPVPRPTLVPDGLAARFVPRAVRERMPRA